MSVERLMRLHQAVEPRLQTAVEIGVERLLESE
jgi:hypothetical protein